MHIVVTAVICLPVGFFAGVVFSGKTIGAIKSLENTIDARLSALTVAIKKKI